MSSLMQSYTVYELVPGTTFGRIVKSGTCQPNLVNDQVDDPATQVAYAGAADPERHYFDLGVAKLRPSIGTVEAHGERGFYFTAPPPEGLEVTITADDDDFDDVTLAAYEVWFAAPPRGAVMLTAPWPYRPIEIELGGDPVAEPSGDAQIVEPNLDRMKARYLRLVAERSEELRLGVLGNPTPQEIEQWKVSRALYEKAQLTPGDQLAIAQVTQRTGQTEAEYLAAVGAQVEFENWVTMSASSLRAETVRRITAATDAAGVLAVIDWAEAEAALAVAEAEAMS